MPFAKLTVALSGALILSMAGASARADAIYSLATVPGNWLQPATTTGNLAPARASTGGLSLGVIDFGGPTTPAPAGSSNLASTYPTGQFAPAQPAPAPVPAPAPAAVSFSAPSPQAPVDAFINLGAGPYANAASLTTGSAQPWYNSQAVAGIFGGQQPNAQQQAAFDNTVLQRVSQTFQLAGVPITLTDNPNVAAAHALSVVSNTTHPTMPDAIGMTYLGGNGFHYIDNAARFATSVDQLEWIVAHNVSHELMLAFGVPEVHDQTGNFIDARTANLSTFLNPYTTFSPGAVQDLLSKNFQAANTSANALGAQLVGPSPTPEPASVALWTVAVAVAGLSAWRRRRNGRASA